jgi:hypothetical protein
MTPSNQSTPSCIAAEVDIFMPKPSWQNHKHNHADIYVEGKNIALWKKEVGQTKKMHRGHLPFLHLLKKIHAGCYLAVYMCRDERHSYRGSLGCL